MAFRIRVADSRQAALCLDAWSVTGKTIVCIVSGWLLLASAPDHQSPSKASIPPCPSHCQHLIASHLRFHEAASIRQSNLALLPCPQPPSSSEPFHLLSPFLFSFHYIHSYYYIFSWLLLQYLSEMDPNFYPNGTYLLRGHLYDINDLWFDGIPRAPRNVGIYHPPTLTFVNDPPVHRRHVLLGTSIYPLFTQCWWKCLLRRRFWSLPLD